MVRILIKIMSEQIGNDTFIYHNNMHVLDIERPRTSQNVVWHSREADVCFRVIIGMFRYVLLWWRIS